MQFVDTYGWHIQVEKYRKGTYLLGINFNSNTEFGRDRRETYIILYLWKWAIVMGKFHRNL